MAGGIETFRTDLHGMGCQGAMKSRAGFFCRLEKFRNDFLVTAKHEIRVVRMYNMFVPDMSTASRLVRLGSVRLDLATPILLLPFMS